MSHKDSNSDSQMSSKNTSPEQDEGSLSSQGKSPAGYGDRQVIQQQEMGGELGDVSQQREQDSSSMNSPSQAEQSESSSESDYSEDSSIERSKSQSTKDDY